METRISPCLVREPTSVYSTLAFHQRNESWQGREVITLLQAWAALFIGEFKLQVDEIVLCLEPISITKVARFRPGHNGTGLKGEIAINIRHLTQEAELWPILAALLMELLHAWQESRGHKGRRRHDNNYRQKAAECGLNVDKSGAAAYPRDGAFMLLLERYGIPVPDGDTPVPKCGPVGNSKMKKWTCGCTNVRCAVELYAQCLNCGQVFAVQG